MKNKGIEIFNDILDLCEKLEVDIHQDSTPKLALTECIGVMRTSYKFSYDEVFLILKRLATRLGGNSKIDTMPMMEMAQFCLERLPVKEGESKPVDWRNCRHDFPPLPNTNILRVCSKCGTTEVTVLKYQVSELNSQLENSWGEVELWTKAAKLNEERWHAERKAKEIAKDWMRRTASLLKLDVPDEVLLAETSNAIVKLLDERSIDKAMIDELRTWLNKSSMTLMASQLSSLV